jgi:hypothetical protein
VTDLATVCIPGSRTYRAGVTRGYARADRLIQMDGVAPIPLREHILGGLPYWVAEESSEAEEYLDGFVVGFAHRVQGRWPNGMVRAGNNERAC